MTSITGLDGLFIVQWNNTDGRADMLYPFCANFLKLENGKRIHVGWLGGWFYTILGTEEVNRPLLAGGIQFNVPFFGNDMSHARGKKGIPKSDFLISAHYKSKAQDDTTFCRE